LLLTKIISGVVVGAAIILSVILFKWAWLLMVLFLSVVGTWELASMLRKKGLRAQFWPPAIMNVIVIVSMYLLVDGDISPIVQDWTVGHSQVIALQNMFMVFCGLILITRSLFLKPRATVEELSVPLFQIAYLGWFPSFFILTRSMPHGEFFLVWALTSTAFSDIGAYFAGKYLGKRPFFQHLSPNKTLEGSVGGVLSSVAMAFILAFAFGKWLPISPLHTLILATGMACLGQVGDLIESLIKRDVPVKDSGNFIPGHGGLLDRIDSYLLLAPFLYYYLVNFVLVAPVP
jgi:phosphatidate cytidylyltransferase